jgi:hypothetical protein
VFEDIPPMHKKGLYLPSTKLECSFHVNMKTFEIFMTQSHFHQNGVPPPNEWLCKEATLSFLQAVKPIRGDKALIPIESPLMSPREG